MVKGNKLIVYRKQIQKNLCKIFKYIKKNHLSIIAILITIAVIPIGILFQERMEEKRDNNKKTIQTYYLGRGTKYNIADLKEAKCWESHSSDRSDSFRCSIDNLIYDPCFEVLSTFPKQVGCPATPEGTEEVFILNSIIDPKTIPEIIEKERDKDIRPWHITLSSGLDCRFITGATEVIADKRIDYGCSDGDKTFLSLPIEKQGELLKINCFNPVKNTLDQCSIKQAWF